MCLLSYADNKNAVAQIGDENREGGYTIFPRKLKSKKKKKTLNEPVYDKRGLMK